MTESRSRSLTINITDEMDKFLEDSAKKYPGVSKASLAALWNFIGYVTHISFETYLVELGIDPAQILKEIANNECDLPALNWSIKAFKKSVKEMSATEIFVAGFKSIKTKREQKFEQKKSDEDKLARSRPGGKDE